MVWCLLISAAFANPELDLARSWFLLHNRMHSQTARDLAAVAMDHQPSRDAWVHYREASEALGLGGWQRLDLMAIDDLPPLSSPTWNHYEELADGSVGRRKALAKRTTLELYGLHRGVRLLEKRGDLRPERVDRKLRAIEQELLERGESGVAPTVISLGSIQNDDLTRAQKAQREGRMEEAHRLAERILHGATTPMAWDIAMLQPPNPIAMRAALSVRSEAHAARGDVHRAVVDRALHDGLGPPSAPEVWERLRTQAEEGGLGPELEGLWPGTEGSSLAPVLQHLAEHPEDSGQARATVLATFILGDEPRPEVWKARAEDHARRGEPDAAYAALLLAGSLIPDDAFTAHHRGPSAAAEWRRRNLRAATALAFDAGPVDVQEMGEEARRTFLTEGVSSELFTAAFAAYLADDLEGATTIWELLVEDRPADPSGYTNLGLVAKSRGAYADEEALHRRAVELAPDDVPALLNLALCLAHQREITEAESTWARVASPDNAFAMLYGAMIAALQDRTELALSRLEQAAGIDQLDTHSQLEFLHDLKRDPAFDALRSEERFQAIVARAHIRAGRDPQEGN